ncbi:hypothetical protein IC582_021770 [Cucumis melo]
MMDAARVKVPEEREDLQKGPSGYLPCTHNLFWIRLSVAAAVTMPNLRIARWIFHDIVDR